MGFQLEKSHFIKFIHPWLNYYLKTSLDRLSQVDPGCCHHFFHQSVLQISVLRILLVHFELFHLVSFQIISQIDRQIDIEVWRWRNGKLGLCKHPPNLHYIFLSCSSSFILNSSSNIPYSSFIQPLLILYSSFILPLFITNSSFVNSLIILDSSSIHPLFIL